jgi:hypothetical protein
MYHKVPYPAIVEKAILDGATNGVFHLNLRQICQSLHCRYESTFREYGRTNETFVLRIRNLCETRMREKFNSLWTSKEADSPKKITYRIFQTAQALPNETLFLISDFQIRRQRCGDKIDLPVPLDDFLEICFRRFDIYDQGKEKYNHQRNRIFYPVFRDLFVNQLAAVIEAVVRQKVKPTHEWANIAYQTLLCACYGGKEALILEEKRRHHRSYVRKKRERIIEKTHPKSRKDATLKRLNPETSNSPMSLSTKKETA